MPLKWHMQQHETKLMLVMEVLVVWRKVVAASFRSSRLLPNAVLFQTVDQRLSADVEVAGGLGLVPVELFHGSLDEIALHGL